jgi:hypothetical protein
LFNTGFEAGLPTQAQLSLATAQQQAPTANADLQDFKHFGWSHCEEVLAHTHSHHATTDVDFNTCTTPRV